MRLLSPILVQLFVVVSKSLQNYYFEKRYSFFLLQCASNSTLSMGRQQRKEVGITAYKKPGPPTPSKQAGRLSATVSTRNYMTIYDTILKIYELQSGINEKNICEIILN